MVHGGDDLVVAEELVFQEAFEQDAAHLARAQHGHADARHLGGPGLRANFNVLAHRKNIPDWPTETRGA